MSLNGKIAIVTGGSRGIGRAICLRLAKMGAFVYVNYVSRSEAAEETVQMIAQAGGKGQIVGFDVADGKAVQSAFKDILKESGSIDILVNNAGITRDGLMARMKESDWDSVLDTNLKGAFLCSKVASRSMMKQRAGRIVNISSVSGFSGNAGQVNYAAAKAGLVGLTKSMAREYASRNITVKRLRLSLFLLLILVPIQHVLVYQGLQPKLLMSFHHLPEQIMQCLREPLMNKLTSW